MGKSPLGANEIAIFRRCLTQGGNRLIRRTKKGLSIDIPQCGIKLQGLFLGI